MMVHRFLLATGLLMALTAGAASAEGLELAADQSKIDFTGTKPDGKHDGGFKKFDAVADINPSNPLDGSLVIEIDTTSLWSDNEKLTNHLKNPDFFDVRKFPKIKFESIEMKPGKERNQGIMKAKMTMLGKTQEVEMPLTCVVDGSLVKLTSDFKIDRTRWGMTYGQGRVDNDVAIRATLVFKQ